jgi:hypothetical protein
VNALIVDEKGLPGIRWTQAWMGERDGEKPASDPFPIKSIYPLMVLLIVPIHPANDDWFLFDERPDDQTRLYQISERICPLFNGQADLQKFERNKQDFVILGQHSCQRGWQM